jgi:predicted DCC family thiol-disulfide oxidoreductase YuxK
VTAPLVVYDGTCGFCTWAVTRLRRILPAEVRTEPNQLLDLAALGLTEQQVAAALCWVTDGEPPRRGARAMTAWLRASGSGWAVLGTLTDLPPFSWLAAGIYLVVSKNRHRIPGPWEHTCEVPPRG